MRGYSVVNKGMENLKKLYGSRGYIQFEAGYVPDFKDSADDQKTGIVDVTFTMEEGKQYVLRRLEFIGNIFSRDNVLRREVLLNEGERYNEEYWDLSILRLNQLGYFDQIKKEDATINTNERDGEVDLTLKVQEKGRQQVSFTGALEEPPAPMSVSSIRLITCWVTENRSHFQFRLVINRRHCR